MTYFYSFQYLTNTIFFDFCEGSPHQCNILANLKESCHFDFSISPIPVFDKISIAIDSLIKSITILDAQGITMNISKDGDKIIISHFPQGLYLIIKLIMANILFFKKW